MSKMQKTQTKWVPKPGNIAVYSGKTGRVIRRGSILRVEAEARAGRMVVGAIDVSGRLFKTTVLADSLQQPQPQLFP